MNRIQTLLSISTCAATKWAPVGPVAALDDVLAHGGLHQTSAGPYIIIFPAFPELNICELWTEKTRVVSNGSRQLTKGTYARLWHSGVGEWYTVGPYLSNCFSWQSNPFVPCRDTTTGFPGIVCPCYYLTGPACS